MSGDVFRARDGPEALDVGHGVKQTDPRSRVADHRHKSPSGVRLQGVHRAATGREGVAEDAIDLCFFLTPS